MATFPLKPAAPRDFAMTLKMVKLPPEPTPCIPDALRLAWFTDSAGTFSETAEAAYLLPAPDLAAGPVLAVAGILGETCGAKIQWITTWTPESGEGGDPGLLEDDARLVVWPTADTLPGLLSVRARISPGKVTGRLPSPCCAMPVWIMARATPVPAGHALNPNGSMRRWFSRVAMPTISPGRRG